MGYSTHGLSRIIACYDNFERYIAIPHGLEENLIEKLNQASIEYEMEDQTAVGYPLRVEFKGNLYLRQQQAVDSLRKHNDGILSASTAFGKTVVGASLIAQIKKSTLILVHTTEILNGWVEELERFLFWDEPLPEYKTPTGRKKIRKSHIGVLYAGKDTCAGKIDVALISSVSKKESEHPFLHQYGMVIMDECHHIPSKTYEQVIQKVPARYRYGFSATPKREDGQDPKIFMYFGPIRYRFSARDRAMQQGIQHLVVPRFTSLRLVNEKDIKIQEAYQMAIENVRRNDLIVKDIQEAIKNGRTPLVLSRSRRHAQYLYRRLEGASDQMFLLQGGKTPRERSEI
ncbi:DEAD/DEAH box helicase, partial [uncultured Dubosiella sp.]